MRTTLTIDDDVAVQTRAAPPRARCQPEGDRERGPAARAATICGATARSVSRFDATRSTSGKSSPAISTTSPRCIRDHRGRGLQVILVDVNLLLCHIAKVASAEHRGGARDGWTAASTVRRASDLPWATSARLLANRNQPRAVLRAAFSIAVAWEQVVTVARPSIPAWIASTRPIATPRCLAALACSAGRPRRISFPTPHLAALAIEHGLILCSTDGDFARFPGFAGRTRSLAK